MLTPDNCGTMGGWDGEGRVGLSIGIVGLPNVGKSTLFNALTRAGAAAANYPFCTIDPNVGVVEVPDPRLDALARLYHPRKVTPAAVTFVDIAGLVRGASKGEGLGNQFLHHIREVDAIAHVVRCFEDPDVTHVEGSVDPVRDAETVELELVLADLESVQRQYDRNVKAARSGDKQAAAVVRVAERLLEVLGQGRPARSVPLQGDDLRTAHHMHLLTRKPVMYVANIAEADLQDPDGNPHYGRLKEYAARQAGDAPAAEVAVVPVCAQIEAELAGLSPAERREFLREMGLSESGLERVIRTGYRLLGLITFLTAGEPEVRAWTIRRGTRAPEAAGEIHSDMERGFIRAEVVAFEDLARAGSLAAAREKGLVRLESRDYVMQDGDVVHFRFNV